MARPIAQKTLLLLLAVLVQWMVLPGSGGPGCATSRTARMHASCCCAGLDTAVRLDHSCCGKDLKKPPCRCSDADSRPPLVPIGHDTFDFGCASLLGEAPRTAGLPALTAQACLRPAPIPRCRNGPPIHVRDCVFLI